MSTATKSAENIEPSEVALELIPAFSAALPPDVRFEDDSWNLAPWLNRPGHARVFNLNFSSLNNVTLKYLSKLFILHMRVQNRAGVAYCRSFMITFSALDDALGFRDPRTATRAIFEAAERWLVSRYQRSTPHRLSRSLAQIGRWLDTNYGTRTDYTPLERYVYPYGRDGSDAGRHAKLIDFEVIRTLVAAASRNDLHVRDQFMLHAFVLLVATGLRLNELMTLPADCVVQDETLALRFYPEKGGTLGARRVPPALEPVVRQAVNYLHAATAVGRAVARRTLERQGRVGELDWRRIGRDENALRHFVSQFLHEWTSDSRNDLRSPLGAWFEKGRRYVDAIGLLERLGSKRAVAREIGTTQVGVVDALLRNQRAVADGGLPVSAVRGQPKIRFENDSRVPTRAQISRATGVSHGCLRRANDLIEIAQQLQIVGQPFPTPARVPELERRFRTVISPVISGHRGERVLEPHQALFVVERHALSEQYQSRTDQFSLLTDKFFVRWLAGEPRARGSRSHSDSVFSRLGVIDPKTNAIVRFTSHDARHWLNTMFERGGLSQQQIALVFGRDERSNAVYDQTNRETRMHELRDAIRAGRVVGHTTSVYRAISEHSTDEAERHLRDSVQTVALMPHGLCTLNWSTQPCPHSLSCFAGETNSARGCCEHLHVDASDDRVRRELERLMQQQEQLLTLIPNSSAQHAHFARVSANVRTLLHDIAAEDK